MPTLSSAFVRHGIATLRDVEDALARQVLHGGDLATNLLEVATLPEDAVLRVVAEQMGLDPVSPGELVNPGTDVLGAVPGDVAQRHGLYPLALSGATLTVAVSEPLLADVEADLGFALGMRLVQRVAPQVRIAQAIARDYHKPLERRFLRLVAKLEGRPDPSPSSMPASMASPEVGHIPRPPTVPPFAYPPATELSSFAPPPPLPDFDPALDEDEDEEWDAQAAPTDDPSDTAAESMSAPAPAPEPEPAPSRRSTTEPPQPAANAVSEGPRRTVTQPLLAAASRDPAMVPPRRSGTSQQMQVVDHAAWAAQQKARDSRQPAMRPRHRGPYTAAMAEQDLLAATTRDDVLGALFDFACQYFEYTALFAVQGDLAAGRDSHGPGAGRSQVTGIGVPLDLPSSLQAARAGSARPVVTLARDGLDARLSKDLQRYVGATVMLLPVALRGRCVLILYGDHGRRRVELSAIGDVIAFAPLVSRAIERVILARKTQGAAGEIESLRLPPVKRREPKQPPVEERAATLAAALDVARDPFEDDLELGEAPAVRAPGPPPAAPPAAEHADAVRPGSVVPAPTIDVGAAPQAPPHRERVRTAPLIEPAIVEKALAPARDPSMSELSTETDEPRVRRRVRPPTASAAPPASEGSQLDAGWDPTPTPAFAATEPTTAPGMGSALDAPRTIVSGAGAPTSTAPISAPTKSGRRLELMPDAEEAAPSDGAHPDEAPLIDIGAADLEDVLPPDGADDGHPEAPLAPDSRRVAVGPRHLRRRHSSKEMRLPSVIVEVEKDLKPLVARLVEGDDSVEDAIVAGASAGAAALIETFPGPVTVELKRGAARPKASEAGPVLRALARIGGPALAYVAIRTNDSDADVRMWATRLLGEIPSKQSADAVARRLLDANIEVRSSALHAARALSSHPPSNEALRDALAEQLASADDRTRQSAIEAITDLRLAELIPSLIDLLTGDSEVAASAEWALTTLARQELGRDTEAWRRWHASARSQHRIEWLIEALMHDSADVRRAAGEELKTVTKEYFGYYEDLPKKERARAQRRYQEWWDTKGKARFA